MRLPGTTPSRPDDTGAGDAALLAALAGDDDAAVCLAMLHARLLVPVVALPAVAAETPPTGPEPDHAGDGAEMAVPALVAADGRRALPVFSSYDALRAWRPDARPVPMHGARAVAGAAAEGYDGIVLDVAGPRSLALDGATLATVAAAAAQLLDNPTATILRADPGA